MGFMRVFKVRLRLKTPALYLVSQVSVFHGLAGNNIKQ